MGRELSVRTRGALAAAFYGGWSTVNIQHTPVPAALYDLSGAYAWSHLVQGLQRFRVAERVTTRQVLREVRGVGGTTDLVSRLTKGDIPFQGRPVLVRLVPTGAEVLITKPVRRGRERLVFAPTHLGGVAGWWWLNDVLSGVALGGPYPGRIIDALEFAPVGIREGIESVCLPGGRFVDTLHEDLGAQAREERYKVRQAETVPSWQRHLIEGQLRLLGSTLDFGNTSRVDRATVRTAVMTTAITPDGELIPYWTTHPEEPGPHFDLLIAGSVTSRVRLAMAASIAALERAGGAYLHGATDSLLIAVTHDDAAQFVPCHGGPHRNGRQRGVLALPVGQADEILAATGAPWRCQQGGDRPMVGYVAGNYKYQLLDPETGEGIATESALGGSYLDPTGTDERTDDGHLMWAVEASLAVARAGMRIGASGSSGSLELPEWADQPAVRPGVAATSAQIERLERIFPGIRLRPFTPYLVGVIDHLRSSQVTPITLDVDLPPNRWLGARWFDALTGEELTPTTSEHPASGEVRVETIRDVVARWRIPDDPHTEALEPVNNILEPGMRRVLPVRSRAELVELVGKEGDDLLSLMHDPLAEPGDELTVYRRSDTWPSVRELATRIERDELLRRVPLSKRTVERALSGVKVSGATMAIIAAAVEDTSEKNLPIGSKICARPGCGVPVTRRRRWCSESCRKKVARARDAVDLHKVGAICCATCHAVVYGKKANVCPSCGGKRLIEVRTYECPECGLERVGDTDGPCPGCEKESKR